jgi:hypothetical protein
LVKSSPTYCNAIASRERAQKSLKIPETRPIVAPLVHDRTHPERQQVVVRSRNIAGEV